MRELLGKNKSGSEKVSTKEPIEFAENPQLQGTTSGAETQSGANMELASLGERILNVNGNEHGERVKKMGQDLEECNLEFPMIERQL